MTATVLWSYEDPADGQYIELMGFPDGTVTIRIYAAGRVTSTRAVEMPVDVSVSMICAVAAHAYLVEAEGRQ